MSEKIEALRREFVDALAAWDATHPENKSLAMKKYDASMALLSALAEQEKCRAHMSDKPCDCPNCAPKPDEPTPKVGVFTSNEAAQSLRRNIVEFEEMDGVTRQSAVPEEPTRSVEGILEAVTWERDELRGRIEKALELASRPGWGPKTLASEMRRILEGKE